MRIITRNFIAAAAMFALAVGCSADDLITSTDLDSGSGSVSGSGSGSGSSSDDVDTSSVGYVEVKDILIDTTNSAYSTKTKADGDISTDDFIISIYRETTDSSSGSVNADLVYSDTYAKTQDLGQLELTVGHYYVNASSTDDISIISWNPEYASNDYDFTIDKSATTSVDEIVCTPATIETTLSLSADLIAMFDAAEESEYPLLVTLTYGDDITVTYDINNNSVTYTIDGEVTTTTLDDLSTAIYFAPQDDANLVITMSGMYNTSEAGEDPVYQYVEWTQTVTGVDAGQSRDIEITIDNYDEGKITIEVTVQNWMTNNEIGVDVTKGSFYVLTEDAIPDDDDATAPEPDVDEEDDQDDNTGTGSSTLSIVWDGGYSFDERYEITAETTQTFAYTITSPTGITEMYVKITSDALTTDLLEEMGLAQEMDLINPATERMEAVLSTSLGFPTGDDVEGKKILNVDISKFMPLLAVLETNSGNTDFVLTVSDASDTCTKTIMVKDAD